MHIHEFQDMMRRVYFRRDFERGTARTFNWLEEEVKELKEALKERNTKAMKEEFADVFAWLASLANVAKIDLEKVAIAKYDNRCPKCGQTPCDCSV